LPELLIVIVEALPMLSEDLQAVFVDIFDSVKTNWISSGLHRLAAQAASSSTGLLDSYIFFKV
jgi:hypothetical protein